MGAVGGTMHTKEFNRFKEECLTEESDQCMDPSKIVVQLSHKKAKAQNRMGNLGKSKSSKKTSINKFY